MQVKPQRAQYNFACDIELIIICLVTSGESIFSFFFLADVFIASKVSSRSVGHAFSCVRYTVSKTCLRKIGLTTRQSYFIKSMQRSPGILCLISHKGKRKVNKQTNKKKKRIF